MHFNTNVFYPEIGLLDVLWINQPKIFALENLTKHFDIGLRSSHLIPSQSLNLGGRRDTTDDVATVPFHPSLSSAAVRESPNPFPSIS